MRKSKNIMIGDKSLEQILEEQKDTEIKIA